MALEKDLIYFRMREEQERRAALIATSMEAREAHAELANRYADQCWSLHEGFSLHLVRSAG